MKTFDGLKLWLLYLDLKQTRQNSMKADTRSSKVQSSDISEREPKEKPEVTDDIVLIQRLVCHMSANAVDFLPLIIEIWITTLKYK